MRITRVEIENFRSIERLELVTDKPFIVLEGANDTGKSNIVLAIDIALRHGAYLLLPPATTDQLRSIALEKVRRDLPPEWPSGLPRRNLVRRGTSQARVRLSLRAQDTSILEQGIKSLDLEINLTEQGNDGSALVTLREPVLVDETPLNTNRIDFFETYLGLASLVGTGFRHIATHRVPELESYQPNDLPTLQWDGKQLKRLLFAYKNHENRLVQAGFEAFRGACKESDLPIGEIFVGNRKNGGAAYLFVRTVRDGLELDIEDRSSGIQQLIFLLGLTVCHEGRIVAIEEPELNLSEDLQERLWATLRSFVDHGHLDQLWITSHSEYFKRWADRYIVSRTVRGTTATPSPMIDGKTSIPFTEPLLVSNSGTAKLTDLLPETKAALGLTEIPQTGTMVYLQRDQDHFELMSETEFNDRNKLSEDTP